MNCVETFLPITTALRTDEAPVDPIWLMSNGIDPESPSVIRCLRDDVLPIIRNMHAKVALKWYSFLVHGYGIVPTAPDDKRLFIHLRLLPQSQGDIDLVSVLLPPTCLMTQVSELSSQIAGVDESVLLGDVERAWEILGAQSEWFLNLIAAHRDCRDVTKIVKHSRQFLHFFANMAQMRVS